MMKSVAILGFAAFLCTGAALVPNPGSLLTWQHSDEATTTYLTKGITTDALSDIMAQQGDGKELLILFCGESQNKFYASQSFADVIRNSASTVYPYVYNKAADSKFCDQIKSENPSANLNELDMFLNSHHDLLTNSILDTIVVNVDSDLHYISEISSKYNFPGIVFVGYRESEAVIPSVSSARLLVADVEPITPEDLYLPEGTEFSIYYADKYLYLTPDIFTGLMTGLFMFFTMLTGLSCLSSVHGSSTFANKMPSLGKEA